MSAPDAFTAQHFAALRIWARGMYPLEAATELLIRSHGGRYARPGHPWVHIADRGRAWIDYDALAAALAEGGPWSGGERRVLTLAASLGADSGELGDAAPGLDRDTLRLVLAAISHAGGSHQHQPEPFLVDEHGQVHRNPDQTQPGALYPWPPDTDPIRS